jgi:hypothetical protein
MIWGEEGIWVPCTKKEYEQGLKKDSLFAPYRRVPIYHNVKIGILTHIKLLGKEPDEWKYEKKVGIRKLCIVSTKEANDKALMDVLNSILTIKDMKTKRECCGCRYFLPSRIGGSGPEGEWFHEECLLGFRVDEGSEKCKSQEYYERD